MVTLISRIRFLPITIFAATLMLTVKIGSIWEGFENVLVGTISVAGAKAQQSEPAAPPGLEPVRPGLEPVRPADPKAEAGAEKADAALSSTTASRLLTNDPTLLTQAEIDLLQQLAERREVLDARERELESRTGLLKAAETRIDRKIVELKELQGTIEGLLKQHGTEQDVQMSSLVKIYETMKPKDAARIFQELEMVTLLRVAERMNERRLAPIMAEMDPEKAKQMTVELTRARQLPLPGGEFGG